jgi:hypothetical protein
MDSTEVKGGQSRARLAYEMSRLRRAVLGFAPMLALVAVALLLGNRSMPTLAFGMGLFVFGVVLLWYGHDVKRAVLPGVAAGTVPLIFALCSRHMGQSHMDGGGMAICVSACVVGGLIAGAVISFAGIRGKRGLGFLLAAAGVTLFTGAMGCVCAGGWGLVGLVLGFGVSAAPGLIGAAMRSRGRRRHEERA